MARTRRVKTDGNAHYHLMSRTNDRRFLFEKGSVKTEPLRRVGVLKGEKAMRELSAH